MSPSVPAPILVRPPVPEIVPENVVLVLSPPVVNVPAPSVTEPAPASEPTVWLKLLRSKVPLAFTVSAPVGAWLTPGPSCNVPALMMIPPV